MKKLLLAAVLFCGTQNVFAQLSISPEVGYQMSKARYKIAGSDENGDFKSSLRLGASIGLGISNHLMVEGGAFFSGKGGKINILGTEASRSFNYIDIPVFINYYTGKAIGSRLFVGVGPYWGYAIGGNNKIGSSKTDLEIGSSNTDDIKPMDFGINANVGFLLAGGIFIRGMYAHGLTNILPGGNSDNSIKNSSLSLSVGYRYTF